MVSNGIQDMCVSAAESVTSIQPGDASGWVRRFRTARVLLTWLSVLMLAAACTPAWKKPVPVESVDFLTHARTETRQNLTVTVAVPTREETELLFGTSLYRERIQPVWIQVENGSSSDVVLLKASVDRELFSPLEAAYQRHSGPKETRAEMDLFFYSMEFPNPVRSGTVTSGFVFTNLDEGFKPVTVELVNRDRVVSFSFVIRVPGLVVDAEQVDLDTIYDEWIEIESEEELRDVLVSLPCCTTNKDGSKNGDPLNVVFIGSRDDIFSALIRSGWHSTEVTYAASAWKTIKSFLFGTRYLYSPISPLYVFGRPQDVGAQKARQSIHLRNHMRIWRTPYLFQGQEVYLGQISRDIGVKFNKRTLTTHAIDPDVDHTRDSLIGDLAYSQTLHAVGFVTGSQVSTLKDTHYNLTPDPYYSDGMRAVMFFGEELISINEIEFLDWERGWDTDALRMRE